MTKVEYDGYKVAVEDFCAKVDAKALALRVVDSNPYFSWSPCSCCERPVGSLRYDAKIDDEFYSICSDCVYFLEYGRLDDKLMLEFVEKEETDGG